ncbi:MAG: 5-(carboxyamino)imidazole ribonucleotide synthase [Micavibrio aeruginosavorus]|uniref:N5-carboxyaminoimidazole ribonucleotide synthase n=1 Tax=Micavibrio aeruginosavorus TaxID=349221 RepID=A0A2W5Q007_9BACT|nr:MAG: 5-(carboxyamino)imidazole ribonucleotide synthase [Micavibrio aeruginosavorus]
MKMEIKTLGILGGGQLGRMSALAAARLGIRTHIYCPEENCPASQVTDLFTRAEYENKSKLKEFSNSVDVISYEFENIPLETIRFLQDLKPVFPDDRLLEVSQNRLKEKDFLNKIGIETAPWAPCYGPDDITQFMTHEKVENCIIKTVRFGYDGKGQIKHNVKTSTLASWSKLNTQEAVIEGIVDFAYEASILVARDIYGNCEVFPVTLNNHTNHILSESVAPAPIPDMLARHATEMAVTLAKAVELVGLLALELFVTKDGKLIANEIAPRTHNSGHWTMDGCNVSQFEQHVRAVCGLPILKPVQHSAVTMYNLIGDDVKNLPAYYEMSNACVHLYGKIEAREGRKMGHVNILKPLENSEE